MTDEPGIGVREKLQDADPGRVASDIVSKVKSSASNTQQALDGGVAVASNAVKLGAAQATAQYDKAYERSQVRLTITYQR